MRYLLDTGILIRLPHRSDPFHATIRNALVRLAERHDMFVTGRQNIAEFWSVSTRPATARGGLGLTVEQARKRLRLIERYVTVLAEPESAYAIWKDFVVTHRVLGKQTHDARLAALMTACRIHRILTLNAVDFVRYPGIQPITPQEV